ncbi:hypothetical protein, partial [Halorubrum ezzemoulense]|uniref:hypothetical protein n=1 Tax=Halorubrum ezzemoulense TaxID=337243 RepID=UPI0034E080B1
MVGVASAVGVAVALRARSPGRQDPLPGPEFVCVLDHAGVALALGDLVDEVVEVVLEPGREGGDPNPG